MRPKLILTDLDGTLLSRHRAVSPANLAALTRAAEGGAEIVVATGRYYGGMPRELRELPFLRYFILMNGAKVYDRQEDRILYRAEIPLEQAEALFDYMWQQDATVDCYQNDRAYMDRRYYDRLDYYIHDPDSRELVRSIRTPVEDFRTRVRAGGDTVQKVQSYFPHLEVRERVMAYLEKEFPDLVLSISMPTNLEINHAGATKGAALLALCEVLGVDVKDTAAFGDGTNDLSMIQTAGVGVAMANGAPEVLAAADRIAPPCEEDGVAQILNEWFPE